MEIQNVKNKILFIQIKSTKELGYEYLPKSNNQSNFWTNLYEVLYTYEPA